jgi:hypothetical protein
VCHMRRRIHDLVSILKATCEEEDTCVSYEEEDTRSCVHSEGDLHPCSLSLSLSLHSLSLPPPRSASGLW